MNASFKYVSVMPFIMLHKVVLTLFPVIVVPFVIL